MNKCCDNSQYVCYTDGVAKMILCTWWDGRLYYVECFLDGKIHDINTTNEKNEIVNIPSNSFLFYAVALATAETMTTKDRWGQIKKNMKKIMRNTNFVGCTLRKKGGEYRVNYFGGKEGTAYYTNDLSDAVETARMMMMENSDDA